MFQKMGLQTRLLGSFMLMGGIVLAVGLVGVNGTSRLSKHIDTLGNNTLPSVTGLWKVNEGQTQVQSSERALLNPLLSSGKRQVELERVKEAWKQIDEGFKQYESTPRDEQEEKIYQKFVEDWEQWKLDHQKFLQEYQKFTNFGIQDPANRMAELVSQGKQNSPEMRLAKAADSQLDRLSEFSANQELDSFSNATENVIAVIDYSQNWGENAKKVAEKDVQQTNSLMLLGMIAGQVLPLSLVYSSVERSPNHSALKLPILLIPLSHLLARLPPL